MDSFKACQFSESMPSTNKFGSKVGLLTKANTSPVLGSSATKAPRRLPYKSSTNFCSLMSMDSTTLLPGIAWLLLRRRTARPPAEVSIS